MSQLTVNLTDNFFQSAAINVIEVDWVDASTSNYYQASTNAQFVAARTAALLISLRVSLKSFMIA